MHLKDAVLACHTFRELVFCAHSRVAIIRVRHARRAHHANAVPGATKLADWVQVEDARKQRVDGLVLDKVIVLEAVPLKHVPLEALLGHAGLVAKAELDHAAVVRGNDELDIDDVTLDV